MRRFIGLAMVAMFGLAGCASNDSARSMESVLGSSTAADDGNETSVVDVVATTLSGESFSLQEALQKKPVVLWFWAPG